MSKLFDPNLWADDAIGSRAKHARIIEQYLVRRGTTAETSFVLNIDAPWGSGKTYFLTRLANQLGQKHVVAYIDAWRTDYAADPLLPVLSAVQDQLKDVLKGAGPKKSFKKLVTTGSRVAGAFVLGASKAITRKYVGDAITSAIAAAEDEPVEADSTESKVVGEAAQAAADALFKVGKKEIDEYKTTEVLVNGFTSSLSEAVRHLSSSETTSLPIFIIIDELDRCRPTYAVQLLERIKHLFAAQGVVFVVATDTLQLQSSIKKIYGNEFDAAKYLQRFFNQTYRLPVASLRGLIALEANREALDVKQLAPLFNFSPLDIIADVLTGLKATPREATQVVTLLTYFIEMKTFKSRIDPVFFSALAYGLVSNDLQLLAALRGQQSGDALSKYLATRGIEMPKFQNVSSFDYLEGLTRFLLRPLSDSPEHNDKRYYWVYQQRSEELMVEHNNSWRGSSPPPSVINSYRELLESAGEVVL